MRQDPAVESHVDSGLPAMVELYCTASCPYCRLARQFLRQRGIRYIEFLINPGALHQLKLDAGARRITVPQIFIGGCHVGGYEELIKLDSSGRLAALLHPYPEADESCLTRDGREHSA